MVDNDGQCTMTDCSMHNSELEQQGAVRAFCERAKRSPVLAFLGLYFLLIPLYRTAALEDSFITPKLLLTQLFAFLTAWVLPFRLRRARLSVHTGGITAWLLLAFVAANALTLLYARSLALGTEAVVYLLSFTCIYFYCLFGISSVADAAGILSICLVASTLTAGWCVAEDAGRGHGIGASLVAKLPDWRGYLAAGLGNTGHIAGYIGLFLPCAVLFLLYRRKFSWVLAAAIILMVFALTVTWSVGSTGSTIIALALWLTITWRSSAGRVLRWRRLWWLVAAAGLAAAFYFAPHPANPHGPSLLSEAFNSERWKEGGPTRLVIWRTTWQMISHHPLLGVGAGNLTLEYVRQIVPGVIDDPDLRPYAGNFTNAAHNEFLQIWCEGGLISLALAIALAATWFSRLKKHLSRVEEPLGQIILLSAGAGFTVFLLDSLMTYPIRLPSHFAVAMFFLAVPAAIASAAPPAPRKGTLTCVLLIVAATICAWSGLHRGVAEYCLKQGRNIAEGSLIIFQGQPASTWQAAEALTTTAERELAQAKPEEAMRALQQAAQVARHPFMSQAENWFRRSVAWSPHYTNASSRLGALLLMQGRWNDAVSVLKTTVHDLESVEIHDRLGLAYYELGEYRDAALEWQLCRERHPQSSRFFDGLLAQVKLAARQSGTAPRPSK